MAGPTTGGGWYMTSRSGFPLDKFDVILQIPFFLGSLALLTIAFVGLPNECPHTDPIHLEPARGWNGTQFYLNWKQGKCLRPEYRLHFKKEGEQSLLFGVMFMLFRALWAPCLGRLIRLILGKEQKSAPEIIPWHVVITESVALIIVLCSFIWVFKLQEPTLDIGSMIVYVWVIWKLVVGCFCYFITSRKQKNEVKMLASKDVSII